MNAQLKPPPSGMAMEERYRAVEGSLSKNKFGFLLHRMNDEAGIKGAIGSALERNGHQAGARLLERDVGFVREFFGGSMRKDGATPAYLHPLCVGLGAAMIGYSYNYVQKGFLHDCIEDAGKRGMTESYVKGRIRKRFGSDVLHEINVLTRNSGEEFVKYLARIFNFNKVGIFMLKFIDNLENLKGLYFDEVPEKLVDSTIEKSLQYVYILKKINEDLFGLMLGLIKGIAPEKFLPAISDIEGKSMRQQFREMRSFVVLNPRENINLALLQALPYAGSPVVTVYLAEGHTLDSIKAKKWDAPEYIEVELPDFVGSAKAAGELLGMHMPLLEFEPIESRLPPPVACTHIFRTGKPENGGMAKFFKSLDRLGKDVRGIYHGRFARPWKMLSRLLNFAGEL